MSEPASEPARGRRPGENALAYAIAGLLWRALRNRRAGGALSVGTLLLAPETIVLASSAFADGAPIPDRHAGEGRGPNLSPELAWTGVPAGTRQLLLVMEDCDVPLKRPIAHLTALFEPAVDGFAEGALVPGADGVRFIPGLGGRTGYHGPRALPRHGVHHYGFLLFALDRAIPEDAVSAGFDAVIAAAAGHVLARGVLTGTQEG